MQNILKLFLHEVSFVLVLLCLSSMPHLLIEVSFSQIEALNLYVQYIYTVQSETLVLDVSLNALCPVFQQVVSV